MRNFFFLLAIICGLTALDPASAQSSKQNKETRSAKVTRTNSHKPLETQREEGAPRNATEVFQAENARYAVTAPCPMSPAGCPTLMNETDFANARNSIRKQGFEDSKLKQMCRIISANCMTTEQVTSMMELLTYENSKLAFARQAFPRMIGQTAVQVRDIIKEFTYEDSRLQFAKYAYAATRDKSNYNLVNDGFTYSSSADELKEFISQQPR
jgi:hypothetical protein